MNHEKESECEGIEKNNNNKCKYNKPLQIRTSPRSASAEIVSHSFQSVNNKPSKRYYLPDFP